MNEFVSGWTNLIGDWHFWVLALGYYVFMAFVGGMVPPTESDSRGYRHLYNSLHILAGNVKRRLGSSIEVEMTTRTNTGGSTGTGTGTTQTIDIKKEEK